MLVPDRRRRVLDEVRRHGSARVSRLAADLGVSEWTVRRDIAELAASGLVHRTRGGAFVGATAHDPAVGAALPGPAALDDVKSRIGRYAADLVGEDSTIMVLGGSTTMAMLPALFDRRLTVVTNGLEIANGLKHAPDIALVLIGGYLHREQMTLLGPMTDRAMADMHVDVIVAGAYGVHPDTGITGTKIIQAGYHQSMLRHTDALMVLADAEKFGRRGPTVLAPMSAVTTLITDDRVPPDVLDAVRDRGPEVLVV